MANGHDPHSRSDRLENPPIRDIENTASARDCTGLVPSAIQDDAVAERYSALYAIHRQKITRPDTISQPEANPPIPPERASDSAP